jgi:hypothetical protein
MSVPADQYHIVMIIRITITSYTHNPYQVL